MVLAEERDLVLDWDYFLLKDLETVPVERREQHENLLRSHIEAFRRSDWPNIKRDLKKFQWDVPDGLEPHWVSPGRAVYWQEQILREPVEKTDDAGRRSREIVERSLGWAPTAGVPANNPSQIAHYLERGLRLRPPYAGVDVEAYIEAASPSEGLQSGQDTVPSRVFRCVRHRNGDLDFHSWKAYIKHCVHYNEAMDEQPPEDVVAQQAHYKFYCPLHNVGFNSQRLAIHHAKNSQRRMVKAQHPGLKQMEVVANA